LKATSWAFKQQSMSIFKGKNVGNLTAISSHFKGKNRGHLNNEHLNSSLCQTLKEKMWVI
jgi:hypothetical protein